jgi:phosphoglucosamine mutase
VREFTQELISSSGFRGLAMKEISPDLMMKIGLSLSNFDKGTYTVGQDVRLSSPLLARSLINGLNAGGSNTVLLGLAPTPAVAFYSRGKKGGAMITASHNPPEYNGVKIFNGEGASFSFSDYQSVVSGFQLPKLAGWDSIGSSAEGMGLSDYVEDVSSASKLKRNWRVGLDIGNGSTAVTASAIMSLSGASVSTLNMAPDGTFPGRGSEPNEDSLSALCTLVRERGLNIGFGYDGDGDRVAVVDERGMFLQQDVALGFVAANSLRGSGGCVVVNVDTSMVVDIMVEAAGGRVLRSKVGDTYILEEMRRKGAVFGGESCGAWIHPERSLCPDGVLSSIVFLNLVEELGIKPSAIGEGIPPLYLVRQKVACPKDLKTSVMSALKEELESALPATKISDIDGIRAAMTDRSWVLVRPSGTEPVLRITAESNSESRSNELADTVSKAANRVLEGFRRRQ